MNEYSSSSSRNSFQELWSLSDEGQRSSRAGIFIQIVTRILKRGEIKKSSFFQIKELTKLYCRA